VLIRQGDRLPAGSCRAAVEAITGRPAAAQPVNPPSRSVAWTRPSCCSVAAARLDWYPCWQMRMMCRSLGVRVCGVLLVPPAGFWGVAATSLGVIANLAARYHNPAAVGIIPAVAGARSSRDGARSPASAAG